MFNKIIVGIEEPEGGRDALALTRAFVAANPDAEVVLVCAFPYDGQLGRDSLLGYEQILREEALKTIAITMGDDQDPRYSARAIADVSPARAIHRLASAESADLIVVGSSRHGLIGRVLTGDVARAVLHGAPCAVAVAPRRYGQHASNDFALIGLGLDSSPGAGAALDAAVALSAEQGATLHVLTSVEMPHSASLTYSYAIDWTEIEAACRRDAAELAARVIEQHDVPIEAEIVSGSPALALEKLSEQADLVVTGSRGYGAFRRVVLGSTSDWLAHHAACPLLVVPDLSAEREPVAESEAAHA